VDPFLPIAPTQPLTTVPEERPIASLRRHLAQPWTRRGLIAAGTALMLLLATWGFMKAVDPGALQQAFQSVSWPWVAAAAVAYGLCQVASALVWSIGLRAGGVDGIGRGTVIGAHWLGRGASELLPAHLGETVRFAAIRRHPAAAAGSGLRIAGTMGAFKVIDALVTFAVVATAIVAMPLPGALHDMRWIALGTLLGTIAAILVLVRVGAERATQMLPARFRGAAASLGEGAAVLTCRRSAMAAITFQLVSVGGRVVSLAALLAAFNMPAGAALVVFAVMVLSGAIPGAPGGVGLREAALVPVLVATYGLSAAPALAFSLGVQALALVVSLAGAGVAAVLLSMARRSAAAGSPALA
jgi:uncharacterized membrane protein YbhN (UPF0104 family)